MRCAVMLIYGCKLVVLSFSEDNSLNTNNPNIILNNSSLISEKIKTDPYIKADPEMNQSFDHKQQTKTNSSGLSTYTIDLRKLDKWLEMRIIDIEFLYGYYEPTLFILCESICTWVGRYSIKKDTCNSVALSINLQQRTHPIIWPVEKLPSDCHKCIAVPSQNRGIGGILIFGVNSLIYINQSVPSYGVSLNSLGPATSNYPFKNMENVKITLDCCQAIFIASDRFIISLKGGELYIVTLITDSESARTIKSFNFEKGPGSVISSCIVKCENDYLFIGSRLGNSILLNCLPKIAESTLNSEIPESVDKSPNEFDLDTFYQTEEKVVKEDQKLETIVETNPDDELDYLLDSHREAEKDKLSNIVSYNFEISDMLINIAPCGHSIIGESVEEYSELDNRNSYLIDLVTSSGHSKNGAISVLQRSLRPEIISTFPIPDIVDLWSVSADSTNPANMPTYLFISKLDSTIILHITSEINELDKDNSVFCTKYASIYCSNLINNKYILQITTKFMFVYSDSMDQNGGRLVCSLDIGNDLDSKIKTASSEDNFIVLLTTNGLLLIYIFDEQKQILTKIFDQKTSIACFSLFLDESNSFLLSQDRKLNEKSFKSQENNMDSPINDDDIYGTSYEKNGSPRFNENDDFNMNVDEDEILYGKSESEDLYSQKPQKKVVESIIGSDIFFTSEKKSVANNEEPETITKTFYLLTTSSEGVLCIFKMDSESLNLVYRFEKFNFAPNCISLEKVSDGEIFINSADDINEINSTFMKQNIHSLKSSIENNPIPVIQEILMTSFGGKGRKRNLLISKIDEDLIIYELNQTTSENFEMDLLLKRLDHEIIIRDKRKKKNLLKRQFTELNTNNETDQDETRTSYLPTFKKFNGIAGLDGIFLNGSNPMLLFYGNRCGLTAHPIWIDGSITSFSVLKNSFITMNGFIYFNKNFDIRICNLPLEDYNGKVKIYYDFPWVSRKIQIRQTVHFVCYHEQSKSYGVVTSTNEYSNKLMQLGGEDKELDEFKRDDNFIFPTKSNFTIQMYTRSGWEPLPLCKISLTEWEHVSCLKVVSLPYEGDSSGFKSYLAASTVYCYNEDVNSRGKIIIFDVIDAVPEPDKPLTSLKIKIILEKEQKGPVTCLESVNGYLIGGVGQKIFIWEYRNNELIGKAFIDANFYVHKMITLKSFVLVADLHRSISLIRFQQNYTKLSFVAKDKHVVNTFACEYLVDNSNLGFLSSDSEKNLYIHMYLNESHDNQGGQWLIRKAEFNVGANINSMFRLKCNVTDPNLDKRSSLADKRQVTYCTTLDGGISYVIPISEKIFRRLFILQNALVIMKSHYAGLNPKSYRAWICKKEELSNPQKNILDGDLLFEFFNLNYTDRYEIAKKIKTSSEQVLEDLTEIFQFSSHF